MKICVLLRGNLRNEDRDLTKFSMVYKTIQKMFEPHHIDFYMHLWGDPKEKEMYEKNFIFKKIIVEENSLYYKEINDVSSVNGGNPEYFNQTSQALSIHKVCNMVNEEKNNYDYFFLTRPDLPFTEKLNKIILNNDTICINEHGPFITSGEYCFVFNKENLYVFQNIFNYLKETKEKPSIHIWFYKYFVNYCGKKVNLLNTSVGVNCEIFKHLENFPYPEIYKSVINFIQD